jgi:hypothetical protein
MKRALSTLFAVAMLASACFAQSYANRYAPNVFYAPDYAQWSATVVTGNPATGAATIELQQTSVMTQAGRQFVPFATNVPILVDLGTNQETVTPSAVSGCTVSTVAVEQTATCTITATFANIHGRGALVQSGDLGIQEAINDAQNSGGGMVYWVIDSGGPITLATGSANTNVTVNGVSINIPTRSTVMGATGRVTTTIGTCAGGWSLGFSTGTEFTAANTTLTAGTTTDSSTLSPAVAFNAAATVPIIHCTTSNASAGAMHVKIWGYKMAASSF